MKGVLVLLFVGTVTCGPFRNFQFNKYQEPLSKYFLKPQAYDYMRDPMANVDVMERRTLDEVTPYHHYDKMVGAQWFKSRDDSEFGGNHYSDDQTEEIPYSVIQDYGPYELRQYASVKFACVKSEVDNSEDPFAGLDDLNPFVVMSSNRWRKTPQSLMFMQLFKYISGVNKEEKEIEMTRPVSTHHHVKDHHVAGDIEEQEMCFYIPAEHQAYPPEPLDSSPVYIRTRPGMRVYAIRFGGHALTHSVWEEQREMLELLTMGKPHRRHEYYTNGYNSPMTMHNRRNEVWIEATGLAGDTVTPVEENPNVYKLEKVEKQQKKKKESSKADETGKKKEKKEDKE